MQKKKNGFSLIELLLVLILIGTLVAMTVNFTTSNKERWSLRDLSREITSTYYQARQRAARENSSMRIEILDKSYTYYRNNGGVWDVLKREEFPDKLTATVTADFRINPTGFILHPDLANNTILGLQTITLSAPRGADFDTMTITIYPYGGLRVEKAFK